MLVEVGGPDSSAKPGSLWEDGSLVRRREGAQYLAWEMRPHHAQQTGTQQGLSGCLRKKQAGPPLACEFESRSRQGIGKLSREEVAALHGHSLPYALPRAPEQPVRLSESP